MRLDLNLTERWKAYASYTMENKSGARPFGMVSQAVAAPGALKFPSRSTTTRTISSPACNMPIR